MSGEIVGRVKEIWRYPVRSLRGESLARAEVVERGLPGDRIYCIRGPEDEAGVSASGGKRKWRPLVTASARLPEGAEGPAIVRLADGREVLSGAPDTDRILSDTWGTPVHLAPSGEPVGDAALHLLTSASLAAFAEIYPGGRFEAARFRPNIVIDCGAVSGFIEQGWVGGVLALGESLRLSIDDHCVRCVMTTLAQGDLPQDPAILEAVRRANATRAGIYAAVQRAGSFAVGDPVRLISDSAA